MTTGALMRTTVLLAIAVSVQAQKVSTLFLGGGGPVVAGRLGITADSSGLYMAEPKDRRLVLRKLDSNGAELWTSQSEEANWLSASVAVAAGGVYVAGLVEGAIPGETSRGAIDVYVAKYDPDGRVMWMRQFGTAADEENPALAADAGGVYVTSGTWVFGEQNYHGFLRKFGPDGSPLWTRDFTGLAFWWMPVAADGAGVYLGGTTGRDGKPWYNGNPAFAFLRKYSTDGSEQWIRRFVERSAMGAVSADSSGAYGVLESSQPALNPSSVRKFDANGNELWAMPIGELANPGVPVRMVAADSSGLYVSGSAWTALRGQCYAGNGDAVVRKLDPGSGEEIWTREFGTYDWEQVVSVTANDGAAYVLAGRMLAKLESRAPAEAGPQIVNECVLNAASNLGGGVAAGELVSLVVTGPVHRVLFNGMAVPVVAGSGDRIAAIVPQAVSDQTVVDVQVEFQGMASAAVRLPVLRDRLGVFSADESGNGQAVVMNEDGSRNDAAHPASPGSTITVLATGAAEHPIAMAISNAIIAYPEVDGGQEDYRHYAQVVDTRTAAGLTQIVARVPAATPTGSAVPLHVRIGNSWLEQALTIAIGQ